jgi:hypothetical protein
VVADIARFDFVAGKVAGAHASAAFFNAETQSFKVQKNDKGPVGNRCLLFSAESSYE